MERPKVNENLCFVCQENEITHEVIRGKESFKVCEDCSRAIVHENNARNKIKQAIHLNDTRHIFEYTLGMNLLPTKIEVKPIR